MGFKYLKSSYATCLIFLILFNTRSFKSNSDDIISNGLNISPAVIKFSPDIVDRNLHNHYKISIVISLGKISFRFY